MAWTTNAYCTLDDVKTALDRRTNVDDTLITTFISQAQAWIDERLGYSFQTDGTEAAPATRVYNGNNHEQLLIDRCVEVVQVQLQTYTVTTDTTNNKLVRTANPPSDITADCELGPVNRSPGFILERLTGVFPLGRRNVVVSGIFGIDTIPDDIKRACTRLAVHYLLQREAGYEDKVGSTEAGYGVKTFKANAGVPQDIEAAVDRRRRRFVRGG